MKCWQFFIAVVLTQVLCTASGTSSAVPTPSGLRWTGAGLRLEASAFLNEALDSSRQAKHHPVLYYDEPFRLRIEVENEGTGSAFVELRLQYRVGEGDWAMVGFSDFPYPKFATPPLSVVSTTAYSDAEETEDLLTGSDLEHEEGFGLKGKAATPLLPHGRYSTEWEWPLVVRRWSEGPRFHADGTEFMIRVSDGEGRPLEGQEPLVLKARARPAHLGGTFIETPARIGPYQSEGGKLYFLMEPSESDNRFMVVASTDGGIQWEEMDGTHRPSVGDLEGVGSVFRDGIIHILHQTSDAVHYHAFATEDAAEGGDRWLVDSEVIALPAEPPTQTAALTARPDGSLVAFYGDGEGASLQVRTPAGDWENPIPVKGPGLVGLSGCQIASTADGTVYLVATAADGSGWLWSFQGTTLSAPHHVSGSLGLSDEENGAFLPLLILDSGELVTLYRRHDGTLWSRTRHASGQLGEARQLPVPPVVTCAVDSDQVGADAIPFGNRIFVLFIDEATRSVNLIQSDANGEWQIPVLIKGGIDAAWVRGSLVRNSEGLPVYGFVYDAGSQGGAGMNRYATVPLDRP
jgi:hypothetical protein